MSSWIKVDAPADLAPGEVVIARAGYQEFAVCNAGGRLHAVSNRCPHQGGDLGDGFLEGYVLNCPLHGWAFDVRTGEAAFVSQPGRIKVYPVEVGEGAVWVEVEDAQG